MSEHVTHDGLALVVERSPHDLPRAPVLLVHGIFVGAGSLAGAQRGLAERGRDAIAVHLRGRFGSRPVADIGRATFADYVQDVRDAAAYVARTYGRPPILLGHSMGGLLVQKALESGVGAAAAVLVCSAPPRGILALTWAIARRMAPYVPAMGASRAIAFAPEDAFALALNALPPERREAVYARDFVRDSGRVLRELALGVPVDARRVTPPMLAITGSDDRFVPADTVRRIATRYGATFREYPGHGHVLLEEPGCERIIGDIGAWLDGHA